MITVSARAGMPLWIPEDVGGHCCATIWHSKGYVEGNAVMANRTVRKSVALERQRQVADRLRRDLLLVGIEQRNR